MTAPARWWAPSAPGIGPDETDLHLLAPGADNEKDLGQAFLALHRVGAAACEAVATQPVADESVFASVLAKAREMAVPQAFGIVSKAVGDTRYGHLLLRDVMDDAETGALSLYRSCLASNVPAAVAAQRVGLVYGVPASEIGEFRKAATDPRTPPATLVDKADRVLFGFAAKLVEAEGLQTKVEVSKAPREREEDRTKINELQSLFDQAERDWHGKDPGERSDETGQFQRAGALQRTQRTQRTKRTVRTQRTQRTREQVQRTQTQRTQAQRAQAHRERKTMRQHVLDDVKLTHRVANKSRSERDPGDVMGGFDDQGGPYMNLGRRVAFVMPTDEFIPFRKAGGDSTRGKVFRGGALEEYIGDPEFYEDEDGIDISTEHNKVVGNVVAMLQNDAELKRQPEPVVESIDAADVYGGDLEENLRQAKIDFLARLHIYDATEVDHVEHAIDFYDPTKIALVYVPRQPGQPREVYRPLPKVTEIIVDEDSAYGYEDPGGHDGRHPAPHLAKNQPLELIASTMGEHARRHFWDDELKAFRTQWHAAATDEEELTRAHRAKFGKAMTPERFNQLERSGVIQRDDDGKFAEVLPGVSMQDLFDQAQARHMSAPPARTQRTSRSTRTARRQNTRTQATRTQVSRQQAKPTQRRRGQIQGRREVVEQEQKRRPKSFDAMILADDYYSAVPRNILAMRANKDGHPLFDASRPWELSSKTKAVLAEEARNAQLATEAEDSTIAAHHDAFTFQPVSDKPQHIELAHYEGVTQNQLGDIAEELMQQFALDSDVSVLRISTRSTANGKADLLIEANRAPLGVQHLIRWNDVRPDEVSSLRIERGGRFQSAAALQQWLEDAYRSAQHHETGLDIDYFANPWTVVWRAD